MSTIQRPDAQSFINMKHIDESAANRLDEYLPGTGPGGESFGRQKKEKPKKKWNSEDDHRPDDFLGSGAAPKKSWKVKSVINKDASDEQQGSEPVVTSPTGTSKRASWHPNSSKSLSSPIKAPWSPPEVQSSLKRTSWQPKSPSIPKSPPLSEDKGDEPKLSFEEAQPGKPSVADATRKHDDHHIDKPDVSSFIAMRHQKEGDSGRLDEYLPGTDPTGSPFGRAKKSPIKKWTPKPSEENERPGEWMGSPTKARKSWAPKSTTTFKPPIVYDSDDEKEKKPEAPADEESSNAGEEVEGSEALKSEPSTRPSLDKTHKSTSAIDALRPDVSSFIQMRHQKEGDTNKLDEYLPGTDPSGGSFGRQKKDKPKKTWNSHASDDSGRPDEFLGSSAAPKKSWKVKS